MAVKNITVTDTLETFRTTFNDLAANDFGDIANLSGSIVATNLVAAMNETISIATSTAGWTIEDSTSTQQLNQHENQQPTTTKQQLKPTQNNFCMFPGPRQILGPAQGPRPGPGPKVAPIASQRISLGDST